MIEIPARTIATMVTTAPAIFAQDGVVIKSLLCVRDPVCAQSGVREIWILPGFPLGSELMTCFRGIPIAPGGCDGSDVATTRYTQALDCQAESLLGAGIRRRWLRKRPAGNNCWRQSGILPLRIVGSTTYQARPLAIRLHSPASRPPPRSVYRRREGVRAKVNRSSGQAS